MIPDPNGAPETDGIFYPLHDENVKSAETEETEPFRTKWSEF